MTAHALIPNRAGTDFHRIEYRPDTPDEAVLREIFLGDAYHLNGIADEIAGGVVIDVGAHIGCVSLACVDRGARKVIALEPNEQNHALLMRNCFQNDGLIHCGRGAVGDGQSYRVEGESATAFTVPKEPDDWATMTFPDMIDHVDEYLRDGERVALLKVDVEGAEYDWFATATPELLLRVNRIAMEWHGTHTGHADLSGRYGELLSTLADTHSVSVFGRPADGGMLYAHPNS